MDLLNNPILSKQDGSAALVMTMMGKLCRTPGYWNNATHNTF